MDAPTTRPALHWRDQDDLEWFVANDLASKSSFGAQLERFRDEVGFSPPTEFGAPPAWVEYSRHSHGAKARRVALRLMRAQKIDAMAPSVLCAVHHPSACALDGIRTVVDGLPRREYDRLDSGRLLAVYPMTSAAEELRRLPPEISPRGRVRACMMLAGRTPTEALRAMGLQKRRAHPGEMDYWRTIDAEARDLLARAVTAWAEVATDDRRRFF